MNTYNITEIELTELLRKQRELVYNHARVDTSIVKHNGEMVIRANYVTESFMNAPLPPLPAKKEDIQPVPEKEYNQFEEFYLENYISPDIDDAYLEGIKLMLSAIWLQLSPSKESQKQSLIDIMEADQRDGMYGVRDLEELRWAFYEAMSQGYQYKDVHPMRYFPQWWSKMKKDISQKLNSTLNAQASVATEADSSTSPDPQNAQKEPVIDNLRDKFFKECTKDVEPGKYSLGIKKVDMAPHDLFEWFAPYLKSNSEPVIDWEGLKEKFKSAIFNTLVVTNKDSFNYTWEYIKKIIESNLSNYYKVNQH